MTLTAYDAEAPGGGKNEISGLRRSNRSAGQRSAELGSTIHFGVFALILAVTMPRLLQSFCPAWNPVDTSWAWMLAYSLQHHLQWGQSIVWTYGPLGFLNDPLFYSDHTLWAGAATARLTSWFVFGLGFACILRGIAPDDKPFARTTVPVAIGWAVGAAFLDLSTQIAVLGVLLLALALAEEDGAAADIELALAGALLALGAMIKSTALIVSLFALLVYPAVWWYAGRRKSTLPRSVIPLLSFCISFCALWSLSSQSLAHLPAYFRGTWSLVSGYTAAMAHSGLMIQVLAALLILLLFAGVIAGFHLGRSKTRVAQCLLLGGLAFWAWKEGFTDQDKGYLLHPMTFYGTALLIASAGTVLVSGQKSRYLTACVYSAYAISFVCLFQAYPLRYPLPTYTSVLTNYEDYAGLMSSESRRAAEQRSQTLAIRAQFDLPDAARQAVGNGSVNIFPWYLMMTQGYDLHLLATPVLQSYSAYTPYLDGLNAQQIWSGGSAEKIIYTYEDLNRKYPPFDEPATFRAMLTCYRTAYSALRYTVLSHVGCTAAGMPAAAGPEEGTFGKWIPVPQQATYAAIGVHTTALGRLENLLFKAHYIRVFFRLDDGSVKGPYRFVYRVAGDGLFIRYFAGSQSEAARLFSGNPSGLRRITGIELVTHPGSGAYAQHFAVRFFAGTPADRVR